MMLNSTWIKVELTWQSGKAVQSFACWGWNERQTSTQGIALEYFDSSNKYLYQM